MSKITENKAFKLFSDIFSALAFMSNEVGDDSYSEKLPENLREINSNIDKRSKILTEADIALDSDETVSSVATGGSSYAEPKELEKTHKTQEEMNPITKKQQPKQIFHDEGIESILESIEKNQQKQKERDD